MTRTWISKIILLGTSAVVICAICYLSSCKGDNCGGDYSVILNNQLSFHIYDKETKQDVLVVGESPYNFDTVKVYDTEWKVPLNMHVRLDGYVGFCFISESDKGKVDQKISKRFYMYFDQNDIDTIDIAFNTSYDECHNQLLKYFKVAYNDSVYFDGLTDNNRVPGVNFIKKE
jgi:hypothetical protein